MNEINVIPPASAGGIDNGYSLLLFLNFDLKKALG